jgi:hypothetical protein
MPRLIELYPPHTAVLQAILPDTSDTDRLIAQFAQSVGLCDRTRESKQANSQQVTELITGGARPDFHASASARITAVKTRHNTRLVCITRTRLNHAKHPKVPPIVMSRRLQGSLRR